MKKQILILAIFTLALLAGNSRAFAQLGPRTTPAVIDPLTCAGTSNFLHPVAGVSYDYVMDGNTGDENVDTWTWFATKNNTFIAAGGVLSADSLNVGDAGELLDASTNYGVIGSAPNQVSITWSPEILANTVYQGAAGEPTFVVGYGTGVNCVDNIQVYEINPILTFTVDIANIEDGTTLAWDAPTEQCVDYVQSAIYDNTSHEIVMDYGKDTLYFEVTAANFVTDWTPTFTLVSGLTAPQTAEIGLATSYANAVAGTFIAGATDSWTSATTNWATGIALTATSPADVANGVSVFVRVIISNLTEESLTASPFTLAVDAIDDGAAGQWDMEDADCTTLVDAADQIDQATHTVNPRPTIEDDSVTPDSNTVTPNARITKTDE